MSSDRDRLVWEWFQRASEVDVEERPSWLLATGLPADIAAEVRELLARDHSRASLLTVPRVTGEIELEERTPERIGPYRVLNRIARGGTSTVFRAMSDDGALVAVKVLRFGLDTTESRRRFQAEQEILGSLRHPSIASPLGGGTLEDGLPWLATELIDGLPLTEFCNRGELSIAERLELFVEVCQAVHFAHVNLVVHRDLKPSNILVDTSGRPRLLDFGIAKVLGETSAQITETGQRILSVNYASPEHLAGQRVTTVSDVFSLGVILCELLCGRRPWDWTTTGRDEVLRALQRMVPPRPSRLIRAEGEVAAARALRRSLRGDLDAIVGRGLSFAPEARYASAHELAADIGRYLRREPVLARPPSALYRARKALQRNVAATVVGAGMLVSVLLFGAVSRYQLLEVREQRAAAEIARTQAEQVTSILVESFEAAGTPHEVGGPEAARKILDVGVRRAEALKADPRLQASLRHALAAAYAEIGLYPQSLQLAEQSLAARRRWLGEEHPATLQALLGTARTLRELGRLDEAERRSRRVHQLWRGTLGDGAPAAASAAIEVARAVFLAGRYDEARELTTGALGVLRTHSAGWSEELVEGLDLLAQLDFFAGDYESAERGFGEALAVERRLHDESRRAAGLAANLAWAFKEQGRLDVAAPLFEDAIGRLTVLLGGDHPEVAQCRDGLGLLLLQQGKTSEAEAQLEQALAAQLRTFGRRHREVAITLNNLSLVDSTLGRDTQAAARLREALAIYHEVLPAENSERLNTARNLAAVLVQLGEWDEAEKLHREALAAQRKALGTTHEDVAMTLRHLAFVVWNRGDRDEAERMFHESLAIYRAALGPTHASCAHSLTSLAWLRRVARGDVAEAESLARQGLDLRLASLGDASPLTAWSRIQLGAALAQGGQSRAARDEAERALAALEVSSTENHWRSGMARVVLGLALANAGDPRGVVEAEAGYSIVRDGWPPGSVPPQDAAALLQLARERAPSRSSQG